MQTKIAILLLLGSLVVGSGVVAQSTDSVENMTTGFSSRLIGKIEARTTAFDRQLSKQAQRCLQEMAREEDVVRKQLGRKDSAAARRIFGNSIASYQTMHDKLLRMGGDSTLVRKGFNNVYSGHLDSLRTAMNFWQQGKLTSELDGLQNKMNQSASVEKFMSGRLAYLQQQLGQLGMGRQLNRLKTVAFNYKSRLTEYKQSFDDPSKMEAKAMELLANNAAFQRFFRQHSELGRLFKLPGGSDGAATPASLQGLQTRDILEKGLMDKFGTVPSAPQIAQQSGSNGSGGQTPSPLDQLKSKVDQASSGSAGNGQAAVPDFKPNPQGAKPFWKRLEYGANLQTTRSASYFPVTSALALTVGYRITNNGTAGIGVNYNVGWGSDIQHIHLSSQGIGFRSFADIRLKGSIWVSGGGELNYASAFGSLNILKNLHLDPWQRSVLFGLTKKYSVGKKLNGNVQLLYDFLYKQQIPTRQPLVFRVGYTFK